MLWDIINTILGAIGTLGALILAVLEFKKFMERRRAPVVDIHLDKRETPLWSRRDNVYYFYFAGFIQVHGATIAPNRLSATGISNWKVEPLDLLEHEIEPGRYHFRAWRSSKDFKPHHLGERGTRFEGLLGIRVRLGYMPLARSREEKPLWSRS